MQLGRCARRGHFPEPIVTLHCAHIQADLSRAFDAWAQYHGKSYEPAEKVEKMSVFKANAEKVAQHNARNSGFKMAINQFADMCVYIESSFYSFYVVAARRSC